MPPLEQSIRSMPIAASALDSSMDWLKSQLPSFQSVALMRTKTGQCGGQSSRTAQRQSHAIGERTALLVTTMIAQRRQEFMEQISVSHVQFDHLEPGHQRAAAENCAATASTVARRCSIVC